MLTNILENFTKNSLKKYLIKLKKNNNNLFKKIHKFQEMFLLKFLFFDFFYRIFSSNFDVNKYFEKFS